MVRLQVSLIRPGYARGKYNVTAKGYILAVLYWDSGREALGGWGPFAYVPIDPAGNGEFFFAGMRAIPENATHIRARCYYHDFGSFEEATARIPDRYLPPEESTDGISRFTVLTDLHLSAKPWKITQALKAAEGNVLFLLGDSTNDGLAEQFERFRTCIAQAIPEKTIFPVIGNHDVLHSSRNDCAGGCGNYEGFQHDLLLKARENGHSVSMAPDGRAYSVRIGDLEIVALQCVTTGRVFRFPEEQQIDWLEHHLEDTQASWHIILCHAPLLDHAPNRDSGQPYLHKNKRLQEIVNRKGRVIFLSGHTHSSPNRIAGNGEYDEKAGNIYLDCGSVVPTDLSGENGLMSPDWKDGCKTELLVSEKEVKICMSSVHSGLKFPRGYYRFYST